jgi:AraC family transcriptional regulator, regulatory protein of adaptative response / methylated-DNA-[protein]-cysteine methyltransferase
MLLTPPVEEMYRALVERDQSFDGLFFACVRTTGIFCRPTCSARKPKRENVEFAASIQDALHRGYRPCLICKPGSDGGADRPWLAPLLDEISGASGVRLKDSDLRARGLDPVQVRRTFKQQFGMTFQAYQRACRLGTAMRALHQGAPTLDAGLEAGFDSDSGFRGAFHRLFGSTPASARTDAMLVAHWIETPLGPMVAVAGDEGLELLEFVDRRALERELESMRRRLDRAILPGQHDVLAATASQLAEYFSGLRHRFDLPIRLRGSDFQLRVWKTLCDIPYGETRSYSDIARHVGAPGAVRAVGTTNGRNQIAIVVPCHRVISADGTLSGYGGGRWRKQWLLDHERGGPRDRR